MELLLTRTLNGFIAAGDESFEKMLRFKLGAAVRMEATEIRNGALFRKWWALAKIAFDVWSELVPKQKYRGMDVLPDFDRFRKDLTILAGFYRPVFNAKGEVRLEAESLKFGNMTEERFEELYSKTIDAILQNLLADRGYTEEKLRATVDRLMEFA